MFTVAARKTNFVFNLSCYVLFTNFMERNTVLSVYFEFFKTNFQSPFFDKEDEG